MNPLLIRVALWAAALSIAGLAGFGLAWQLQDGTIAKIKLEQANERINIQRVARATIERIIGNIAAAQTKAAVRNVRVLADADNSRNAGNGLRIASTATVRSAEDFTDACRSIIGAYDTVVETGSNLLREVARAADQCDSDLQLIQEAWPDDAKP